MKSTNSALFLGVALQQITVLQEVAKSKNVSWNSIDNKLFKA